MCTAENVSFYLLIYLTSVKFNTPNLFQEFSLSPGWKTPWACPGADGIRDSDVTIFHWRHRPAPVTSHPIRCEDRLANWQTRKCTNRSTEFSTAPASTPAELEEVRCVKYEFLRPGISPTVNYSIIWNLCTFLSQFCYLGAVKWSDLCCYNIELVPQKRLVPFG